MPRRNRIAINLTEQRQSDFWAQVDRRGRCWIWTGRTDDYGYGHIKVAGRTLKTHRVAWTLERGEIPADLVLDHHHHSTCGNPRCVNPDHLEPVTNRENIRRGKSPTAVNAMKTHCKRGHPLSGDNVTIQHGRRNCRLCQKERRAKED
jgi:hypothetical protein